MWKQSLVTIWTVMAISIGSFGISLADEPIIVPNDPLVTGFEQTHVWWALKSQRDMAMDERISNVMNLGSHNSFNASAEGYNRELLYQPNQLFTITDQLRIGVRLIELDVYDDGTRLFVSHTDSPIVYKKDFPVFLNAIKVWLDNNVNEIIFLDIEDGASGSPLLLAWICTFFGGGYVDFGNCQDPSNGMIFTPVDREGDPFYGRWPTRNELLALGKRVILFNHKDLSDGNYRLFTAYSAEDDKIYLWRGSDYFFSTGSTYDISQAFSDSTINDFWDGKDLPASYQQDISRFFAVRSDGLGGGPRAMVGTDVAYCAMNNVNFIKMDFVFGQEYDIDDFGGTSHNDYDAPGGWGSIEDGMEPDNFLDNIRGNRLSRAIWSWQIDTYRHNSNIYLLSYQNLHSQTARLANRTDGRHYVVQEGFYTEPFQLILSQDWLGVATDPSSTYFKTTRGNWNTQEKENVHPFACARIGSNRTEWRITQQTGSWDKGQQICDQEFNDKGDGTWAFAGPVNGYQNLLLLLQRWYHTDPTQPVWINVSDRDNDAVWTVRETGENSLPIADAGPDQSVSAGPECTATVSLDGSGSYDLDNDPLTYKWTWNDNISTGVSPTILLPVGTTIITIVVNDGIEDSTPDTITITVTDTTSSSSGSSGCFITTAAYGSPM